MTRGVERGDGRKTQERGAICIRITDSCCCRAVNQHKIVKQLYSSYKKKAFLKGSKSFPLEKVTENGFQSPAKGAGFTRGPHGVHAQQ